MRTHLRKKVERFISSPRGGGISRPFLPAVFCDNQVFLNQPAAQAHHYETRGSGSTSSLAEFGSIQMEFAALSARGGDPKFARKAEGMISHVERELPGMVRTIPGSENRPANPILTLLPSLRPCELVVTSVTLCVTRLHRVRDETI